MKKKILSVFCLVIFAVTTFTACGSSNYDSSESLVFDSNKSAGSSWSDDYYSSTNGVISSDSVQSESSPTVSGDTTSTGDTVITSGDDATADISRKLIRRVNLSMETLEFDAFVSSVETDIIGLGGYIQTSSIGNNSYYSSYNRYASMVLRIPSQYVDEFVNKLGNMATITNKSENSEDVTLAYVDADSQLKSLEIQQERLLEFMEKAETVEDIITIEQRLSEIRYQIQYYGSVLRNYDNLVEYSTVTLSISEVKRITTVEEETVGKRITSGLSENLYNIKEGFIDFFVDFTVALPYLLIWAVIITIVVLIVVKVIKKTKRSKKPIADNVSDNGQNINK